MFFIKNVCVRKIPSFCRVPVSLNLGLNHVKYISNTPIVQKKDSDPGIKLKERDWQLEFHQIKPDSRFKIYAKLPVKVKIIEGKKYAWCACGFSNTQPFCDGTHGTPQLKITLRPVVFKAPETKEVWFCNCKMTKNRPFCDGTHRSEEVQKAFDQTTSHY